MKVITGTAKGRKLATFAGDAVRPTTDYIKQAIFNIIQFDIEGRHVLDLFAGTGQLGIEALSRGAAHADFVDTDTAIIKKNLEITGFLDKASIKKIDVTSFLRSTKDRYDLIFIDPPYNTKILQKTLNEISGIDILRVGGIIVCEGTFEPNDIDGYKKSKYGYSGKVITLYTREAQ